MFRNCCFIETVLQLKLRHHKRFCSHSVSIRKMDSLYSKALSIQFIHLDLDTLSFRQYSDNSLTSNEKCPFLQEVANNAANSFFRIETLFLL